MEHVWLLAQAETNEPSKVEAEKVGDEQATTKTPASEPNAAQQKREPGPGDFSWILIIVMIVAIFFLFRGPQKKEKQRKKMIQALQKNDRVMTLGGIIGTVVDIKENEITLKVDESNNTKIKVSPSAIGENLSKGKQD